MPTYAGGWLLSDGREQSSHISSTLLNCCRKGVEGKLTEPLSYSATKRTVAGSFSIFVSSGILIQQMVIPLA